MIYLMRMLFLLVTFYLLGSAVCLEQESGLVIPLPSSVLGPLDFVLLHVLSYMGLAWLELSMFWIISSILLGSLGQLL